ncbi:MAG: uroporphyrinogen-III synthase [Synechococcaceae cyanobacterium]
MDTRQLDNQSPGSGSDAAVDPGPLAGQLIAVTRAEQQLGEARRLFAEAGARVLDLPALVVTPPDAWGPLDDALADLDSFHWIVFSSANGVEAVERRLRRLGGSLGRRPASLLLAAVGRRTARVLEELGAAADFVPPEFVADSLIDHFPVSGWGLRLLLPRVQSGGRTLLAEAFAAAGGRVVEVAAYETRCPDSLPSEALLAFERRRIDAITFSSGKTVSHICQLLERCFGEGWRQQLEGVPLVSIGPQTSRRCLELLGRVDAQARPHDLTGLVSACCSLPFRSVSSSSDP